MCFDKVDKAICGCIVRSNDSGFISEFWLNSFSQLLAKFHSEIVLQNQIMTFIEQYTKLFNILNINTNYANLPPLII